METMGKDNGRVGRSFGRFALAAVLALAMVGLSQCRVVDETVTGVEFAPQDYHGRSSCYRACNDAYKKALQGERARHRDAERKCRSFKRKDDRKACERAEDKVHKGNLLRLKIEKNKCKAGCYNEGGGHGGR
jgi:hypothetical protein